MMIFLKGFEFMGEKYIVKSIHYLKEKCRGSFIVFTPFLIVAILGFAALAVDLGSLRAANAQLKSLTDAAALAGVNALPNGNDAAIDAALDVAEQNNLFKSTNEQKRSNTELKDIGVKLGVWDSEAKKFTQTEVSPNAVQVTASLRKDLFFSGLYTSATNTLDAISTASVPQDKHDIVFLVDLSSNMRLYSTYLAYPNSGLSSINANLREIYDVMQMRSPQETGTLTFSPKQITSTPVYVYKILFLNTYPSYFPYPHGSWYSYIAWSQGLYGTAPANVGMKDRYSLLSAVAWMVEQRPGYASTPVFWKAPLQPLHAVKNSIKNFTTGLKNEDDRVSLIIYNAANVGSNPAIIKVEQALTTDLAAPSRILNGDVVTNTPGRQPAHYSSHAEMKGAMTKAVDHLLSYGRAEAKWIIYLISSAYSNDPRYIQSEMSYAFNNGIVVNAIGFKDISGWEPIITTYPVVTGGSGVIVKPYATFSEKMKTMLDTNHSPNPREGQSQASAQLVE